MSFRDVGSFRFGTVLPVVGKMVRKLGLFIVRDLCEA
jgi:hypothetical protein